MKIVMSEKKFRYFFIFLTLSFLLCIIGQKLIEENIFNYKYGFLFPIILSFTVSLIIYFFQNFLDQKKEEILANKSKYIFKDIDVDNYLNTHLDSYKKQNKNEKQNFIDRLRRFAAEKKFYGIKLKITPEIKLLTAISAIYPVMYLPNWKFTTLNEIIIYPNSYNEDYDFEDNKKDRFIAGTSFTGANTVSLSLKHLKHGFANNFDGYNVGIHEMMHKIDEEDGFVDGIPSFLANQKLLKQWQILADEKIKLIKNGKIKDINTYGATNRPEFFAVICEYFFENPKKLKKNHPTIYKILTKFFHKEIF